MDASLQQCFGPNLLNSDMRKGNQCNLRVNPTEFTTADTCYQLIMNPLK